MAPESGMDSKKTFGSTLAERTCQFPSLTPSVRRRRKMTVPPATPAGRTPAPKARSPPAAQSPHARTTPSLHSATCLPCQFSFGEKPEHGRTRRQFQNGLRGTDTVALFEFTYPNKPQKHGRVSGFFKSSHSTHACLMPRGICEGL
jgi:hypothetical protein